MTNFPENMFRTSIATYAFTKHETNLYPKRTTDWFPSKEGDGNLKKILGRNIHHVVKIKNKFFGSGTSRNK